MYNFFLKLRDGSVASVPNRHSKKNDFFGGLICIKRILRSLQDKTFDAKMDTTLNATTLNATTLDATTLDATTLNATTLGATTLNAARLLTVVMAIFDALSTLKESNNFAMLKYAEKLLSMSKELSQSLGIGWFTIFKQRFATMVFGNAIANGIKSEEDLELRMAGIKDSTRLDEVKLLPHFRLKDLGIEQGSEAVCFADIEQKIRENLEDPNIREFYVEYIRRKAMTPIFGAHYRNARVEEEKKAAAAAAAAAAATATADTAAVDAPRHDTFSGRAIFSLAHGGRQALSGGIVTQATSEMREVYSAIAGIDGQSDISSQILELVMADLSANTRMTPAVGSVNFTVTLYDRTTKNTHNVKAVLGGKLWFKTVGSSPDSPTHINIPQEKIRGSRVSLILLAIMVEGSPYLAFLYLGSLWRMWFETEDGNDGSKEPFMSWCTPVIPGKRFDFVLAQSGKRCETMNANSIVDVVVEF